MRLQSLRTRAAVVTPIWLALGAAWLIAARVAGAGSTPALLAFVVGAVGVAFVALNDPRARLLRSEADPLPVPAGAVLDPLWRHALAAVFPSTVGVSILAAIALAPSPVLAALLGGVCAGLGVAALAAVPRIEPDLYLDPRGRAAYRGELPSPPCRPGS